MCLEHPNDHLLYALVVFHALIGVVGETLDLKAGDLGTILSNYILYTTAIVKNKDVRHLLTADDQELWVFSI